MNFSVDISFPFKASSVSPKLVNNLLFIGATEFEDARGIECAKRFFKKYKNIDYTFPSNWKQFTK